MKNVLEFLEADAARYPQKIAFADSETALTYADVLGMSQRIGSALTALGTKNRPVAVYLDKTAAALTAMLGAVYSGNFYVMIDSEMPADRIERIFASLQPVAILTDAAHLETAQQLGDIAVFELNEALKCDVNEAALAAVRDAQIDTDPLYALYTSGSTGMPKGAVLTHRNVIAYSEWTVDTFGFNENTVFGNQTPFYFSMSVTDIYSTLRAACTLVVIPKSYFSFPMMLVEYLNQHRVNTIYWVPSALSIVANLKLFDLAKPEHLKMVLFAGEVMPTKQLNYWIHSLDESIVYANLCGPTETTDICTYYVVDRAFSDDEPLPIGKHCNNCDVFILKDDGTLAASGEEGELYVRGSFLAQGYYNNPEKTAEAFVQNPLQSAYPERVYKTGDLVKMNERGEIMYICRKDYQIKHMGYRIELGEIETAASACTGMQECVCIFDDDNDKIVLVYSAKKTSEKQIMEELSTRLTSYLMPNRLVKMRTLPHNQNGKIDRKLIKQQVLQDNQ